MKDQTKDPAAPTPYDDAHGIAFGLEALEPTIEAEFGCMSETAQSFILLRFAVWRLAARLAQAEGIEDPRLPTIAVIDREMKRVAERLASTTVARLLGGEEEAS